VRLAGILLLFIPLLGLIACSSTPNAEGTLWNPVQISFDATAANDLTHGKWQIQGKFTHGPRASIEFKLTIPEGTHENDIPEIIRGAMEILSDTKWARVQSMPDAPSRLLVDGKVEEFLMYRPNKGDAIDSLVVNFN